MEKLFKGINIPRMIKIRQRFPRETIADVTGVIKALKCRGIDPKAALCVLPFYFCLKRIINAELNIGSGRVLFHSYLER